MYNLTATLPFLGADTNFQADGKKLLVLDFLAFDLAINKYNIWVSADGNYLSYSIKIPVPFLQFDGNRDVVPGTEASLRSTLGRIRRTNNDSLDGVWSTEQKVGPLDFPVETVITSKEIIWTCLLTGSSMTSWLNIPVFLMGLSISHRRSYVLS
jgi:hypothetical protein